MHPVTNSDAPNEKLVEKVPQMPCDPKSIPMPLESFRRIKGKSEKVVLKISLSVEKTI